jgi:hypothetical protein
MVPVAMAPSCLSLSPSMTGSGVVVLLAGQVPNSQGHVATLFTGLKLMVVSGPSGFLAALEGSASTPLRIGTKFPDLSVKMGLQRHCCLGVPGSRPRTEGPTKPRAYSPHLGTLSPAVRLENQGTHGETSYQ